MEISQAYPTNNAIPPHKVESAFRALCYFQSIESGGMSQFGGQISGRALTHQEKRVMDAALSTLAEYFNDTSTEESQTPKPPTSIGGEPGTLVPKQ